MGLDPSQITAVHCPFENSIFTTAPPGYGKTHVIMERIKYILKCEKVRSPQKILGLTFTNAAANEMKRRITLKIPEAEDHVDIMNFHTLAYQILKVYGNYIGIKRNFTIISEEREYQFKRKFFEELGWLKKPFDDTKYIQNGYDRWFSENFLANRKMEAEYEEYNDLKEKMETDFISANELNFNYILIKTLELLHKFPKIKDYFFNKYPFILADEFQDTNYIQYTLFKEISINSKNSKRNVFVVGDEKQAIMKFQGANPANIQKLIKDFNCESHELKENHRTSSDKIKILTQALRRPNTVDMEDRDEEEKFEMYVALKKPMPQNSVQRINSAIIEKIVDLKDREEKLENICILFPQEKTPKELKKTLETNNIEFIQINDFNFRSINKKYSKLFDTVLYQIDIKYNKASVSGIIRNIIKKHYLEYENDVILQTIENFSKKFDSVNYSSLEIWEKLQEFYNHIQMDIDWTKLVRQKVKGKIFLSTIHSAKGLEFKYVFMLGIVNYQIPHHSTCFKCKKLPEKLDVTDSKYLFYVGVSRAINNIFFFFSNQEYNFEKILKIRSLSCVFEDIGGLLTFINVDNNQNMDSNRIKRICCKW
jgi:DNA helicase-2/ATP-dependent DNA helicase PcrA